MVIPTCQKAGSRGRTRRYCVPLRVRQAIAGESLECRHIDSAPIRRPRSTPGVVIEDNQDIWGSLRRCRWQKRIPVGNTNVAGCVHMTAIVADAGSLTDLRDSPFPRRKLHAESGRTEQSRPAPGASELEVYR